MSSNNGKAPRMRLVGWNVQPVIMSDDGENLITIPVGATMIPVSEWGAFKQGGDQQALEALRQQIEVTPKEEHVLSDSDPTG
jgi:hypothetical protein